MSNNPERQEGMEGQSELDIHGCMEELKNESTWVVTNWDGEVLCRCINEHVAILIARSLNKMSAEQLR